MTETEIQSNVCCDLVCMTPYCPYCGLPRGAEDEVARVGRQVAAALMHDPPRYDAAYAAIRSWQPSSETSPRREARDSRTHVAEVFETRIANALEEAGYITMQQLAMASDDDLLRIPNLGQLTLSRIRVEILAFAC